MSDNVGSKLTFFLAGLGIGALVGVMFAPQSGEETRKFLSQKADEGRQYAQRKARELRERAEDTIERSKEAIDRQRESLSAAFDAGKDAYQREKSKTHS
jgi:gas vesicle protein